MMLCAKCKRTAGVAGVAGVCCACAVAAVHHESLCGRFDRGGAYCTLYASEQPHDQHRDGQIHLLRSYNSVVTSSASLGWGTIPDRPSLTWWVKKGG
jgi:hypothetical protein